MLWVKSFHIVFLVAWYAGLFYLPRLFIMMPCMALTIARDANTRSHVFYRWINEIPLLYLVAIVILVVVKPF